MFDPFKDFETAGYLRNLEKEKDPSIIKRVEHAVFMRNLDRAMEYLRSKEKIRYEDFLEVHGILFSEFYPWAGCDRANTAPRLAISKGSVMFCNPADIARAINEGLRLAQSGGRMRTVAGTVMGFFAYGHPFLDGNGRTMLLVHCELTHRAGFSIDWSATKKSDYLAALTSEIEAPGNGHLDQYLRSSSGIKSNGRSGPRFYRPSVAWTGWMNPSGWMGISMIRPSRLNIAGTRKSETSPTRPTKWMDRFADPARVCPVSAKGSRGKLSEPKSGL